MSRIDKHSRREYNRAYNIKNRDKVLAQRAVYYKQNKKRLNARSRVYYVANRQRLLKQARVYAEKNLARILLRKARERAKKFGLEFNLTLSDIVIPDMCPVFGHKLSMGVGKVHHFSPTLDRINSLRGYVKGNIAVISQMANDMKANATAAQHRRIAEWMESVS